MINSIHVPENLEIITKGMSKYQKLQKLDVSHNPMSMPFCKYIGYTLIHSIVLKDLNVSNCKIGFQGTRYIIDGLLRNNDLNGLNFASNDLSSSVYEFSIKIGKILTRH